MRRTSVVAALGLAVTLMGCSPSRRAAPVPDLHATGAEAPVAVTSPTGPERLPQWDRRSDGRATLVIPSDLLFAKDSAALAPDAAPVLAQVVDEVHAVAGSVLVEGHADSDGDAAYNQDLSERRADAVGAWLADHGVAPSAITTRGWGATRPAVQETDEAAKAKNRRVVVTVTPQTRRPQ